jgi:hypothetical protein
MAFPFYPLGLITATLALGGMFLVLRVLLLALDRGAAELRGSIGPGLVRGVRAWAEEREREDSRTPTTPPRQRGNLPAGGNTPAAGNMPPGAVLEELTAPPHIAVESVRTPRSGR